MDTRTRKAAARRIMLQNTSRVFMQWYEPRKAEIEHDQPLHVFAALFQDGEGEAFFSAMPDETILSGLQELIDAMPVIKPLGHEDARIVAEIRSWMVDALANLREAQFLEAWMYLVDAANRLDWLLYKKKRVANTQAHRHLNADARATLTGILNLVRATIPEIEAATKAVK